jgi:hypothetical protein
MMRGMNSTDEEQTAAGSTGFSAADLQTIRRESLMDALEVARHEHDPASDWEAFCAVVWREAGLAFGFLEREPWPEDLPRPAWPASRQGEGQDSA